MFFGRKKKKKEEEKEILQDGLAESYKRSQELAQKYREEHGLQN